MPGHWSGVQSGPQNICSIELVTAEISCFLVRMAFQMLHFYSHIAICSFYAPLRGETSVDLALGPSAKILCMAIIPLICQEDPAVLPPPYIHTRANRHTTFFKQGEIFLTCALRPCFLSPCSTQIFCLYPNQLFFAVYSRYFVLIYQLDYIYPSSLNHFAT